MLPVVTRSHLDFLLPMILTRGCTGAGGGVNGLQAVSTSTGLGVQRTISGYGHLRDLQLALTNLDPLSKIYNTVPTRPETLPTLATTTESAREKPTPIIKVRIVSGSNMHRVHGDLVEGQVRKTRLRWGISSRCCCRSVWQRSRMKIGSPLPRVVCPRPPTAALPCIPIYSTTLSSRHILITCMTAVTFGHLMTRNSLVQVSITSVCG